MFRFFLFRLPFSWKTPAGFTIAILIESVSSFCALYSILPIGCFTIGSYLLLAAAIKFIANGFRVLCKKSIENGKELENLFVRVISDVSDLKRLS